MPAAGGVLPAQPRDCKGGELLGRVYPESGAVRSAHAGLLESVGEPKCGDWEVKSEEPDRPGLRDKAAESRCPVFTTNTIASRQLMPDMNATRPNRAELRKGSRKPNRTELDTGRTESEQEDDLRDVGKARCAQSKAKGKRPRRAQLCIGRNESEVACGDAGSCKPARSTPSTGTIASGYEKLLDQLSSSV